MEVSFRFCSSNIDTATLAILFSFQPYTDAGCYRQFETNILNISGMVFTLFTNGLRQGWNVPLNVAIYFLWLSCFSLLPKNPVERLNDSKIAIGRQKPSYIFGKHPFGFHSINYSINLKFQVQWTLNIKIQINQGSPMKSMMLKCLYFIFVILIIINLCRYPGSDWWRMYNRIFNMLLKLHNV